jgi:hypothetical protein
VAFSPRAVVLRYLSDGGWHTASEVVADCMVKLSAGPALRAYRGFAADDHRSLAERVHIAQAAAIRAQLSSLHSEEKLDVVGPRRADGSIPFAEQGAAIKVRWLRAEPWLSLPEASARLGRSATWMSNVANKHAGRTPAVQRNNRQMWVLVRDLPDWAVYSAVARTWFGQARAEHDAELRWVPTWVYGVDGLFNYATRTWDGGVRADGLPVHMRAATWQRGEPPPADEDDEGLAFLDDDPAGEDDDGVGELRAALAQVHSLTGAVLARWPGQEGSGDGDLDER